MAARGATRPRPACRRNARHPPGTARSRLPRLAPGNRQPPVRDPRERRGAGRPAAPAAPAGATAPAARAGATVPSLRPATRVGPAAVRAGSVAALVTITVPLETLQGMSDPGEVGGFGRKRRRPRLAAAAAKPRIRLHHRLIPTAPPPRTAARLAPSRRPSRQPGPDPRRHAAAGLPAQPGPRAPGAGPRAAAGPAAHWPLAVAPGTPQLRHHPCDLTIPSQDHGGILANAISLRYAAITISASKPKAGG